MSMSSVSHQLRVLREHDLVRPRREGKIVFYSLADPHVLALHETALEHVRE
jgi:ArsR family transcriptional regulator